MEWLVSIGVRLVLLVVAVKLFLWARRLKKAAHTRWRRRLAMLFFLAPMVVWLGEVVLPDALAVYLGLLTQLSGALDRLIAMVLERTDRTLPGIWALAVTPLIHAAVYSGAGALVGWPLDRMGRQEPPAQKP